MTYNVLAQSYAYPDRYVLSGSEALDRTRRHALLLARVIELDADLLCLQELEPSVYEDLFGLLTATHHSAYVRRGHRPDGVAIFARRSTFGWRGHQVLHFEAHRPDLDDLVLVAQLSFDERPLHVCCIHLPRQSVSVTPMDNIARRQMVELLAYRDETAPNSIWIFAGDLNATPQSDVVAIAMEQGMEESCRGQRPSDTCVVDRQPGKLDYLLFSKGQLKPRPGVLPALLPHSVLPSLIEPSDHLPLRVDFSPVR